MLSTVALPPRASTNDDVNSRTRYVVQKAAGSPLTVHRVRMTPTWSAGETRNARPMSSGTSRSEA
jgi:hypothetical protein